MRITKRQLGRIIRKRLVETLGPEPRGRIADDQRIELELQDGTLATETIPYYIIEDAIADGLSHDGVFVEIEEYIDELGIYPPASWQYSQATLDMIRRLVP